jgi:hypothetical protein
MYIGLITLGDDYGRLIGDSEYLKTQLFPYDSIAKKAIEKMRDDIRDMNLITVFKTEKGTFIHHPNWNKYQKLRAERIKESEVPSPPSDIRPTTGGYTSAQEKVSEDSLSETEGKAMQGEVKDAPVSDFKQQMLAAMPPQTANLMRSRGMKDEAVGEGSTLSKEDT